MSDAIAPKRTVGVTISPPSTLNSSSCPSGELPPSSSLGSTNAGGSATQGSVVSPALIAAPTPLAFSDPLSGFIDDWCLEEDVSVLKPQLMRRLHRDQTSPLDEELDDDRTIIQLEHNIAKKLSVAILRRLRLAFPMDDDMPPAMMNVSAVQESARRASQERSSAATDHFTQPDSHLDTDEAPPLNFDVTSPGPTMRQTTQIMGRSQSFDNGTTSFVASGSRRSSAASPSTVREAKLRKELLRSITGLAVIAMENSRKLHVARESEQQVRAELRATQAALDEAKANAGRRRSVTTLSHLMNRRRSSALSSNDGVLPVTRSRRTTAVGIVEERSSPTGSPQDKELQGEEDNLRPPPLLMDVDTPRGPSAIDAAAMKTGKSLKSMAEVVMALSRAAQSAQQHQQQTLQVTANSNDRTPRSENSATPRGSSNPFVRAMSISVRSMMNGGAPLTPQTAHAPTVLNQHASMSVDDIGMPMVNQYLFLSELGSGAQGSVSLVLDTESQELRAVKVITRPRLDGGVSEVRQQENKKKLSQLRKEVAIMKQCRHKNVVRLYEVIDDVEADSMYLVMQYVEKGPVATITGSGIATRIPPHTLAAYCRQLCSGLRYLHSKGIVHRDIKPENILLGANDTVYLADFGISSIEGSDHSSDYSQSPMARAAKTSSQVQRGTIAFLAPELLREDPRSPVEAPQSHGSSSFGSLPTMTLQAPAGEPVDIWALGLSIYAMLYGKLPWKMETVLTYVTSVVSDPIEFPATIPAADGSDIPLPYHNDWLVLLQGMLNRDEKRRFTAEQAYKAAKTLQEQCEMGLSMAVGDDREVADADLGSAITAVRRT